MTPEQQIVFDAVMQALRVHAVKIEDLTPVSDVPTGAYVELSGGRRISAGRLASVIGSTILSDSVLPLINGEAQSRVEADNALSGRITAETTARENAISNISQVACGYAPKSRLDTLNGLSHLGLWRIGNSPSMTSSQSNYGNVLVYADYGNYVHQMYFGSLDPNTWTTPESGKKHNIYGRSYYNNAWSEWERVNGDKSDIIDLGEFERSGEGEAKAATLKYCADPNILFMKYTITGKGVATIQQSVVGSRCQQLLFLEGQWFTRYISFTTAGREIILQVTAWWRTMPTNVDYDSNSRRVRLVDYNRQHSLPENKSTDGFELPLATGTTAGLMSGDDKTKLDNAYKIANDAYAKVGECVDNIEDLFLNKAGVYDISDKVKGSYLDLDKFKSSLVVYDGIPVKIEYSWIGEFQFEGYVIAAGAYAEDSYNLRHEHYFVVNGDTGYIEEKYSVGAGSAPDWVLKVFHDDIEARKQDVIIDLDNIRSGASNGQEALAKVNEVIASNPLRPLFLSAGAQYNDTDNDKTMTDPFGEQVTWKAHHYYLNGLGDITEDEMARIYDRSKLQTLMANMSGAYNGYFERTNLPSLGNFRAYQAVSVDIAYCGMEIFAFTTSMANNVQTDALQISDAGVRKIIGTIALGDSGTWNAIINAPNLEYVMVKGTKSNTNLAGAPKLSLESFRFMVDNAENTGAITVTVHQDVMDKMNVSGSEWEQLKQDAAARNITFTTE